MGATGMFVDGSKAQRQRAMTEKNIPVARMAASYVAALYTG